MSKHQFLWVDVQAAELHPSLDGGPCGLLEIAWAWVADDAAGDLSIVSESSLVLRRPLSAALRNPRVSKIHEASGLLAECARSDVTPAFADLVLDEDIQRVGGAGIRDVRLAGWGVALDQAWIKAVLPCVAARLHYLPFDVAALEAAAGAWLPGYRPQKPTARRSPENLRQTIEIVRTWRSAVGL